MQRFQFHSRTQKPGETVAAFIAELRQLSEFCEFGNNTLDNMVRRTDSCAIGGARANAEEGSDPRSFYRERREERQGAARAAPTPGIEYCARRDSATRSPETAMWTRATHGLGENSRRYPVSSVRKEAFTSLLSFQDRRVSFVQVSRVCRTKGTQSAATGRQSGGGKPQQTHLLESGVQQPRNARSDEEAYTHYSRWTHREPTQLRSR